MPAMARVGSFKGFLCAAIAIVWALGGGTSSAEPLRLVTDLYFGGPDGNLDDNGPGFPVEPRFPIELVKQVFAAMGQDISVEAFPTNRDWRMVLRGEADGMLGVLRSTERERICSFPDEPLGHGRWVLFVRAADVGKLKFTSFDDLVGHDVAVREAVPGLFEQPTVSPEMWQFLREHHNMVETIGVPVSFRMLAKGRVDYAVAGLGVGKRALARMGLTGTIDPLLSRSVFEGGVYVCFSKVRVSPALVDAFSRALREFKQTEAYRLIYQKYFP
jgi:polar amino acid transport system substrate-binding protein